MDSELLWLLANALEKYNDTGWLAFNTLVYQNSWANVAGPAATQTQAGIRRIGNVVYMGGTITSGTSGNQICGAFPAMFRPITTVRAACVTTVTSNTTGVADVTTAGVFVIGWSGGTAQGLDGISWLVN